MNPATPRRRLELLSALARQPKPVSISALARAADLDGDNGRHTIYILIADGHVERVGERRGMRDARPVRVTPAGQKALSLLIKPGTEPGTGHRRLLLLRHVTHMEARAGEKVECAGYDECMHGAALRAEYSAGARCPSKCGWYVKRAPPSAVEYTSSGASNYDAAIYAGAWT